MSSSAERIRVLGRYALHGEIASGGMATVHFGRLLGPIGFARTVAIKRLHSNYAKDPDFVSMFIDEARLAARIRHLNTVSTLDVVAAEDELFLVMEYVEGEALSRLIFLSRERRERMPFPILSAVVVGMLHGLHAAHEAVSERGEPLGIVHRDVSPHNLMVGRDGIARLLDFGIAKAAGRMHKTRTGELKGKLEYMPPEQIRGNATRSSDIYSSGLVLWETITGRRHFKGESAEILMNVLAGEIVPPSVHSPDVPPELEAIVLRSTHSDPSKRFPTALAMADAIEACVTPASPSVVGEWVDALAMPSLIKRAEIVAAIENAESYEDDGTAPGTDPRRTLTARLFSFAAAGRPDVTSSAPFATDAHGDVATDVSAISTGLSLVLGPYRWRTRVRTAIVALSGAALGAGGLYLALASRHTSAVVDGSSDPRPVVVAPLPTTKAPEPVAVVAPATARPSAAPSASVKGSDVNVVIEPDDLPPADAPVQGQGARSPRVVVKPASKNACDPPYTIDADGFKHYDRDCLKRPR